MALLKYFKNLVCCLIQTDLYQPSSSIVSANKEVENPLDGDKKPRRGQYTKYSDEEKAKVAKRASEMGVTSSLRFSKKEFSGRPLKESTIRTWKAK